MPVTSLLYLSPIWTYSCISARSPIASNARQSRTRSMAETDWRLLPVSSAGDELGVSRSAIASQCYRSITTRSIAHASKSSSPIALALAMHHRTCKCIITHGKRRDFRHSPAMRARTAQKLATEMQHASVVRRRAAAGSWARCGGAARRNF